MRSDKQLINESKKLRKLLNSNQFTGEQKDKAWIVILTLQWVKSPDLEGITPLDFCGVHGPTYKNYLKRDKK